MSPPSGGELAPHPAVAPDSDRVGALVLAAGPSTRMGDRYKLLLPYRSGTVVRAVADAATAGGLEPLIVVVGHRAREVADALEGIRARLVENPAWREGMGGSIAAGVRAIVPEDDLGAVAVLLGDEPGVRPEVIRRAVAAWREARPPALRVVYADRPGHPALLGRALFPALRDLRGDRGVADSILAREEVVRLRLDVAAPVDVDTPGAYRRAVRRRVQDPGS